MLAKNAPVAEVEPTQGQNMPVVKSPRTGPATIPLTLIAACKTVVPVNAFAPNAHIIAHTPDTKTTRREDIKLCRRTMAE